jgi:hypothetical protein
VLVGGPHGQDEQNVEQPVEHGLLTGSWLREFSRDEGDHVVHLVVRGTEAFIDADDIAAAAAATLADPAAHAGAAYSLTGPQALTVSEAAALISEATGQTITHLDLDRDAWIVGAIANGVPAEYEAVLRPLTETVESGNGSRPNGMVEQITGTPPRTFRDFARENAAAWSEAAA